MISTGLIPAAGHGVRAYPRTSYISKTMLDCAGKPLILRNIEIMRDQLHIKRILVIIGHLGEQLTAYLGDGSRFGVAIEYIRCDNPETGLARGILLAKPHIQEPFLTILGDELYIDSDHSGLSRPPEKDFSVICGINATRNPLQIRQNYSVKLDGDRIVQLTEKPALVENNLLGCGTYVFTPRIFEAIESASPSPKTGLVELTEVIDSLARKEPGVLAYRLSGECHNINSISDYNAANYALRSRSFGDYSISLIIPAFNEESSIGYVINDFSEHVDEILVVDNSSTDNTAGLARELGARVETVRLKGYGDAIKYGLDNAKGEILVIVEADYSFRSRDLHKILEYLKDADMVMGTRTTREMIEQGANMRGLIRWGNVFVAKLVELLWWGQEPRFTDVGCTYRAVWRDSYLKFRDRLTGTGPEFSLEMMIEALRARQRVLEIPISYYARVGGVSKHSGSLRKVARTALRMLAKIVSRRFKLERH
jgi:dTDP-glucose pyrophosphorylase